MTRWTEARLGGYSLLFGTVAVAVGYALSPGRGMVDTVPSTSLADLTLAMARNATLSYTVAVVLVLGALLMLNGIVAVLALGSLALFIAAWHSNTLELSLAPVFGLMPASGIVYMGLLG